MRPRLPRLGRALIASLLVGAAGLSALWPSEARAELTPEKKATAGAFFEAGAQAFDTGKYLVAAEAFLKSYEILESPALLFSAAQSYRRQYLFDTSPEALDSAVRLFRQYVQRDPKGKRREDAVLALTDLVPLHARLGARGSALSPGAPGPDGKPALVPIDVPIPGSPGNGPPENGGPGTGPAPTGSEKPIEAPRSTRLLISAKPATAEVSVDGGAFTAVPAVIEVKKGQHTVRVRAAGYLDDEVGVLALPNELVPSHVVLKPKSGRLVVTGPDGASVAIDGQVRAALPMAAPIDVEPGDHFISVTKAGRLSFGKTIAIERDKLEKLPADLPLTGQRIAAYSTLGVGLAGAALGGILAGFMLDRNATASSLEERRQTSTLLISERDALNDALSARDDFGVAAGVAGGAAALVLLTSAGFFLFDQPDVLPIPSRGSDTNPKTPAPRLDFMAGLTSAAIRVTF